MVALARFFDWRGALAIVCERKVKPATFLKWHRTGFKLFWRWKSRYPGRPPLPKNLRELAIRMAHDNPTWGEQRIASELSLKLGIRVAPRTVAKYLDFPRPRGTTGGLRWSTFLRNHAKGVVICDPACDFFVSITATFRVLYVFVAMEIGSRRILHTNFTAHPTADWTIQQFREFLAPVHRYHFLIRDRDGIFLPRLDAELSGFGVHVLKTPPRTPTANAYCERLIGTIRRECLDYLIPVNERHLRLIVKEFACHYNRGRPHSSLGPGIPEPPEARVPAGPHPHKPPAGYRVRSTPVLSGLHHEYRLEKEAA
jgi:putative transposase